MRHRHRETSSTSGTFPYSMPSIVRIRRPPTRRRGVEQVTLVDSDGSDVEIVDADPGHACNSAKMENLNSCVPCEICGQRVPFCRYSEHVSTHSDLEPRKRRRSGNERIPCDACGEMIPFEDFLEHSANCPGRSKACKATSSRATVCKVCGALVEPDDMRDHEAAHAIHEELVHAELQNSTSEVDVTVQVVDFARKGGSGLPGNRKEVTVNHPVLVRWSDGHWYQAHVVSTYADGRHQVAWDPPYQDWGAEDASADAVIPRMDQAREVCNFDVALSFVKKLKELKNQTWALELVYHWTREENVNKIVENNLKVPGSTNADGTKVVLKNGAAFGSGIYAATDMNYGAHFGGGLRCAFLCLATPGFTKTCRNIEKLQKKHDSLQHGQLRVYRSSDQLLPLFFTDRQNSASLEKCARGIATLLEEKILGMCPLLPGAKVEVLEDNHWWKGEILQSHPELSKFDVKWLPPYADWPPQMGVCKVNVRRCE